MLPAATDVTLTMTLQSAGAAFTPSQAQMQVRGPLDAILQPFANITPNAVGMGFITFTVPAALNTLGTSTTFTNGATLVTANTREARVVDLSLTSTAFTGTVIVSTDYVISQIGGELVLMTNSFQSYTDAILTADEIPDLTVWHTASKDERVRAMSKAFRALGHLNFEIYYDREDIYFRSRASWGLPYINTIGNLYTYPPQDFLNLDPDFIHAVQLAQVAEADILIQEAYGNSPASLRSEGIISKTVGEDSIMVRSLRPLDFGVSRKALRYLGNYVKFGPRTVRS